MAKQPPTDSRAEGKGPRNEIDQKDGEEGERELLTQRCRDARDALTKKASEATAAPSKVAASDMVSLVGTRQSRRLRDQAP